MHSGLQSYLWHTTLVSMAFAAHWHICCLCKTTHNMWACHYSNLWANICSMQAILQTVQQPCRCVVDVADIDQMNILQAALKAMEGAVAALPHAPPDYLLVDGNQLPKAFSKDCSQTVVRGDSMSTVIAAASILAKASVKVFCDISSYSTN